MENKQNEINLYIPGEQLARFINIAVICSIH